MKKYFTIMLLFFGLTGFSQTQYTINLEGAFQFYNYKSISLGVSINKPNSWKIKKADTFIKSVVYFERFINNTDIEKINVLGCSALFGTKYFNIGINLRHLFLNKIHRLDLGPMFRLGYKYAWVSYSIDLTAFDNPYSTSQKNIINLNNYESNIKLIVTLPIFNKK